MTTDATSDTGRPPGGEADTEAEETEAQDTGEATEAAEQDPDGADQLGDPGKRALDAMKDKWRTERDKRKALEAQLADRGTSGKDGGEETPGGPDPEAIRREVLSEANQRIIRAEVRAAAAGKLADPADATRFLDLGQFEVGDDGSVDGEEIADAIEDLIKNKPYLAAQSKRFQGSADGGARKGNNRPGQLTRDDLSKMSAAQIVEAKAAGRLDEVLGIQTGKPQ